MLSIRRWWVILALVFVVLVWVAHSPPNEDDPDANDPWQIITVIPNGTTTPATTTTPQQSQDVNDDGLDFVYKVMVIIISSVILVVVVVVVVVAIRRGMPLDLENGPFAMALQVLHRLRGFVDAVQERRAIRALR